MHQNAAKMERATHEKCRLQRCEGVCLSEGPARDSILGEYVEKVSMWVDAGCISVEGSVLQAVHAVSRPTMLFHAFPIFSMPLFFPFLVTCIGHLKTAFVCCTVLNCFKLISNFDIFDFKPAS